jgi:hypothetical protein
VRSDNPKINLYFISYFLEYLGCVYYLLCDSCIMLGSWKETWYVRGYVDEVDMEESALYAMKQNMFQGPSINIADPDLR